MKLIDSNIVRTSVTRSKDAPNEELKLRIWTFPWSDSGSNGGILEKHQKRGEFLRTKNKNASNEAAK